MDELDLTDPAIREMAEYRHQPEDVWSVAGRLLSVHCGACNQPWPCSTAQRLRGLAAKERASAPAPRDPGRRSH